jgi:hypothetical protein
VPGSVRLACDGCEAIFYAYPSRVARHLRHYCSITCKLAAHKGTTNPNYRGVPDKFCLICGSTAPKYGEAKGRATSYCSLACTGIARREQTGSPRAKLTVEQIPVIRERLRSGAEVAELAAQLGMSIGAIRHIRDRSTWRSV